MEHAELRPPVRVSVVIPALNVEGCLRRCLESLRASDYPETDFEIIVVDNGSIDTSVTIAEELASRVVIAPGLTIGALRNLGARYGQGELLAFIDSDCLASREWLSRGVAELEKQPCVIGSRYDLPENPSWVEYSWFSPPDIGRRDASHVMAGNMFVPREYFERVGGFDETLRTGEDAEFCSRLRKHIPVIRDSSISVVHLGNPRTLRQFLRREIWYGIGALGSFKVDWRDKPLLATVAFGGLSIVQIGAAAAVFGSGRGVWVLAVATLGILGILFASSRYRAKRFLGAIHGAQLMLLFYVYYVGRVVAFYYDLSGRSFYHHIKKEGVKSA